MVLYFRLPGEDTMMLSESKYFPGHPTLVQPPYSPTFGRKDIFSVRKQREFIPENKKDDSYWDRRRRNNEAAKRSREKRRLNDMLLETRVLELTKDNHILQAQLTAIYEKYGIKGESMISMEQVLATLPTNDQVLNFTKKRLGPMPGMMSTPPSPIHYQSLSLPLNINNNNTTTNNNNSAANNSHGESNGNNGNSNNNKSSPEPHSPGRSYRSPSPHYTAAPPPNYTDIRSYAETGHMYRHPAVSSRPPRYEEDHNDDKDSGLALNLSTDRAGSDGRSSGSGSPPVTSSNIGEREGSSSGDESGYPRSPNSGETSLPHKLRFKSLVNEKEAVSSLLSLHQIAMIKREPTEHINHWMERMEAGGGGGGIPAPNNFFAALLPPAGRGAGGGRGEKEEAAGEPLLKRARPENLTDEVARLTSEVATLKNILVNRMKEETGEECDD